MLLARVLPNVNRICGARMLGTSSKKLAEAAAIDMPTELASDEPMEWESTPGATANAKLSREKFMDRVFRVDHAGEYGADRIYAGQHLILQNTPVSHIIREMWKQEVHHLGTFEKLLKKYNYKKSKLLPLWDIGGYGVGMLGALISKEAAMAVTVAIEDVIGTHYNDQVRDLLVVDPNEKELLAILKEFRDDELHHYNTGLDFGAEKSKGYGLIKKVVGEGCKLAVYIAERV